VSKFLISCGGTGGHLSPGISLAQGLVARGHEATLLVSQKRVDSRLLEKYPDLTFERMPGTGFSWHPGEDGEVRVVADRGASLLHEGRPHDAAQTSSSASAASRRRRPPRPRA
jgi:hypothetical protein